MSFEIDAVLDEATSRETFDVLDFVKGANTPEKNVTIYTDADAALKLAHIFVAEAERSKRASAEPIGLDDEDGPVADEDEINELTARLTASGLVFKLKGLLPAEVNALEKNLKAKLPYKEGAENPEFTEAFNSTLIAKSIQSVTRADGVESNTSWSAEKVAALNDELYVSEGNKLFNAAAEVNFVGAIFDRAVSADFS